MYLHVIKYDLPIMEEHISVAHEDGLEVTFASRL